ncbi:MAG: FAD-binding oxidoreductase, partial [Candidatus Thorarchaeota archaeon]
MTIRRSVLEELSGIFGDRLVTARHELILHSMDVGSLPKQVGWLMKNVPDALVQPVSAEEVRRLYEVARKYRLPLTPRGAGTSGYGGAIPRKGGVVVDMRRMDRILAIDRDGLTVTVEPGRSWASLQLYLNRQGLDLRCYPSSGLSATIGGWIAQGGDGIGSLKYGKVNDNVVRLEVVLPDGRVIETSDTDLFCDTEGILGIITKVTLRVKPLTTIRPIVVSFPENYLMVFAIERIIEDGPLPYTMKFEEAKYVDLRRSIWDGEGRFPFPPGHCTLLVAYEGSDEEIEQGIDTVRRVAGDLKGRVYDENVSQHEWEERYYPMRIKKAGPTLVVGQAFAPIERLEAILDDFQFEQGSAQAGVDGYVTSRTGVTMMGYFLEDERRSFFMFSWSQSFVIFKIAQRHGGHPHSTGIWLANYAPVYFGKRRLSRIRAAKLKFDPDEVSNPGKIFAY